jgi:hypothetical protein
VCFYNGKTAILTRAKTGVLSPIVPTEKSKFFQWEFDPILPREKSEFFHW